MTFRRYETSPADGAPIELFRFVQGATVWTFSSADIPVVQGGDTYVLETIERSALEFSQEDTAGNITIRLPRANPVAQLFIAYNPPSIVTVAVYARHRPDSELVPRFVGRVVACAFDGAEAELTCAPLSEIFKRRVPSMVFQSHCGWALYGPGCLVNKASFATAATVAAVAGAVVTATAFGTHADGWYTNGWLERANGERRFIVDHVGTAVTLMVPFGALAIAEAVTAYAGCMRTEAVCATKFSNLDRFLGFPRIPSRNPYTQSLT